MFEHDTPRSARPIAFCLHYLGGSAREWDRVAAQLASRVEIVAIDLPGFGDARDVHGYAVAEMVAYVADAIRARRPRRFILVGHSMGAKVAVVLASEVERGNIALPGLAGLITVAGSPPAPEPMEDAQREKMLGWFGGDARSSEAQAREFVRSNSDHLEADATELAVTDALRTNRFAWVAWLEDGSREDWSGRVGVLQTPAIAIAGADDPQLGPEAQRRLMLPHFASAQLMTLPHAKHLLPLECADDLARTIELAFTVDRYRALIASSRVSTPTRDALRAREKHSAPDYAPQAIDRQAFATLRALIDRIVPQARVPYIDLAARIDEQLHAELGDGWRFAALPSDAEAYAAGLATLDDAARSRSAQTFADLDAYAQDALLASIAAGECGSQDPAPPGRLSRDQMRMWFEDVRAEAVKAFALHPQTLARMGYSGIANGGDALPKSGFARVGLGEREAWEPIALGNARA